MTVAGNDAHCGTLIDISTKGGLDVVGHVGACHLSDCRYNDALECRAEGIRNGPRQAAADCLTYSLN